MTLTPHQLETLHRATAGPIGILGGGPGTGKTFTVAELCKMLSATVGLSNICIGAPTGKAAVRVTETLAQHGIPLRARTWHSILRGGTEEGFEFCRENPLPYRVLIGDETSMVDCDLMAAIMRARAKGTLCLFVGDVNQLPPVGHGAPLRDMIAAGLPYGELTEIKRNDGGIVAACHQIRQGKPWKCQGNLRLVECDSPEGQIAAMLANVRNVSVTGGLDPVWDCQIVVPVNAKSPLARKTLNDILQRELNAGGQRGGNNPFRVDDKIVNTKNGRFTSIDYDQSDEEIDVNDKGEVYVANGELAKVLRSEDRSTVAELQNPHRVIRIPRGNQQPSDSQENESEVEGKVGTGCTWDLGYALSVHKSQGSEWPVVLVMLDEYPGAKMICDRSWIYTAISRAKTECILIGKKENADAMCKRNNINRRKTFLRERILIEVGKRELA